MKLSLIDGYKGLEIECDAKPLEIDRNMVKLQICDSPYTRWLYYNQWAYLTSGRVLDNGRQIATWAINPRTGYTDITYPDGKIWVTDCANWEFVANP